MSALRAWLFGNRCKEFLDGLLLLSQPTILDQSFLKFVEQLGFGYSCASSFKENARQGFSEVSYAVCVYGSVAK